MPFYRFQDPAYNLQGGAFPGAIGTQTYSRVNVTNGGVGGGDGSANADAAKAVGPNAGTYFVSFGEDATSSAANRGLRALAQNTDAIDNVLRGSIPYVGRLSVSGTGSTDVAVSEMFVGELGMLNTAENVLRLVHIEALTEQPVLTSAPAYNQPTPILIHDGTGTSVIGTTADGFRAGVVVRFNVPIPAGTYNLFIGMRTSYAKSVEMLARTLVEEHIRGRHFDLEVWKNFTYGLDEKYRRATTRAVAPRDTPGSGAVITRDGQALQVGAVSHDWSIPTAGCDPLNTTFLSQIAGHLNNPGAYSDYSLAYSGHIGYTFITNRRGSSNIAEYTPLEKPLAAIAVLNPADIRSAMIGARNVLTYIPAQTAAVLNPAGVAAQVQVAAPYYFRLTDVSGYAPTALLLGYDMLLITVGGITQTYIIDTIVDAQTVTVKTPAGVATAFVPGTAATVQWVQFSTCLGGVGSAWSGLTWTDSRRLLGGPVSGWGENEYAESPPRFIGTGGGAVVLEGGFFNNLTGQAVGGWSVTGNAIFRPGLGTSMGSMDVGGGSFFKVNQGKQTSVVAITTSILDAQLNLWRGSCLWLHADPVLGGTPAVVTVHISNTQYTATAGDQIEVFLENSTGQDITIVWGSGGPAFRFSGSDAEISPGVAAVYRWTGTMGNDGLFYMTRTDYVL